MSRIMYCRKHTYVVRRAFRRPLERLITDCSNVWILWLVQSMCSQAWRVRVFEAGTQRSVTGTPHHSACFSQMRSSLKFFRWIHLVPISLRLFMLLGLLLFFMMANFSEMHKSQLLFPGWYVVHFFSMFHLIFGLGLIFLSQMYWDRVVAFIFDAVLKEWTCWVYLVLNLFCVMPM